VDNDENKKQIAAVSFNLLKSCRLYVLHRTIFLRAPFPLPFHRYARKAVLRNFN